MEITLNYQTIPLMLNWAKNIQAGKINENNLDKTFGSNDYIGEFSRYTNRVSKEDFKHYILTLVRDDYSPLLSNSDLINHHSYWQDFIKNIDWYEKQIKDFLDQMKDINISKLLLQVKKCFPTEIEIATMKIIFTFGIGQSFGFPYKNAVYSDILQAIKDNYLTDIEPILCHEIHHIIFSDWLAKNCCCTSSLDKFLISFASEGLAIKFTQNAKGVLSKPIYKEKINIGLDAPSVQFLNSDFNNTYNHFKSTINKLQLNIMNEPELNEDLSNYWLSLYKNPNQPTELIELKHSRLYTFGNELWRTLFDAFGLEVLFETLRFPGKCLDMFNEACLKLGLNEYIIINTKG